MADELRRRISEASQGSFNEKQMEMRLDSKAGPVLNAAVRLWKQCHIDGKAGFAATGVEDWASLLQEELAYDPTTFLRVPDSGDRTSQLLLRNGYRNHFEECVNLLLRLHKRSGEAKLDEPIAPSRPLEHVQKPNPFHGALDTRYRETLQVIFKHNVKTGPIQLRELRENLEISRSTTSERLRFLRNLKLVADPLKQKHSLTELGEQHVRYWDRYKS
ncbi:MAG: hypothetical protein AAF916_04665 [Planctomycetota bacterium]